MGDKSGIEWTEATWNPIAGCSIVSPGCQNCYAMRQAARIARMQPENVKYQGVTKVVNGNAVWTGKVNLDEQTLFQPLDWKKPRYIFVNSMSDLFHESVADFDIARILAVMGLASWHTFQVLTKRPARMAALLNSPNFAEVVEDASGEFDSYADERAQQYGHVDVLARMQGDWRTQDHTALPMPNVWLGVSVEDQQRADERIPHLLRTPAAVRWLSCEPLLGALNLGPWMAEEAPISYRFLSRYYGAAGFDEKGSQPERKFKLLDPQPLHWVVCGGESGEGARSMSIEWAAELALQCQAAGVPFFMKQLGGVRDKRGELESFPPALRVREYPKAVRA